MCAVPHTHIPLAILPRPARPFSNPRKFPLLRPVRGNTQEQGVTTMATYKLLLLPGDGIGPEVMAETERVLAFLNKKSKATFETSSELCGGCSIDKHGTPLTERHPLEHGIPGRDRQLAGRVLGRTGDVVGERSLSRRHGLLAD